MFKNMIISGLAAGEVLQIPWLESCDSATKFCIWLAVTVCILFFLLFLEQMYEKWVKYRRRLRKIKETVARLRYEKREIRGNS